MNTDNTVILFWNIKPFSEYLYLKNVYKKYFTTSTLKAPSTPPQGVAADVIRPHGVTTHSRG